MPQSWPGSSGGLAQKRGPGTFDRERPHCLLSKGVSFVLEMVGTRGGLGTKNSGP